MNKQTTKTKISAKRGAVQISAPEPTKRVATNGRKNGGLAHFKQQRSRKKPFTKEEQERIDLWRAIFAAMEKEEEKAQT